MTPSLTLIVSLAALILLSRPWLDARRPVASVCLLIGTIAGPSITAVVPPDLLASTSPILAIGAGWLALLAAESWDLATLRRLNALRRIPLMLIPALIIVVLALVWPTAIVVRRGLAALSTLLAPAVILACASQALDPDAAREGLARTGRPDLFARHAPAVAAIALGTACFASSIASGLHATLVTLLPWVVLWHPVGTLLIGALLGMIVVGLLRIAQGRAAILALLIALPLLGHGIGRFFEMSPLAITFIAGCVLANDPMRRDLVFTVLREHQRAATAAVLLIAGARIPLVPGLASVAVFWLMALSFAVARPLAWRLAPRAGPGPDHALVMSPLAIVLSLEILVWQGGNWILPHLIPSAVAVAFIVNEFTWLMMMRRGPEAARGAGKARA